MNFTHVDDSDPGLTYTPANAWTSSGGPSEYNQTTHFCSSANSTVTLVFNGTGVGVYGTVASLELSKPEPPMVAFKLDDLEPSQFSAVPIAGEALYRHEFYNNSQLENKKHTLVVTNLLNSSAFFLDYFLVASPTPELFPTPISQPPKGAIIGGAIGGFAFILAIVVLLLVRRSSRRKAAASSMFHGVHDHMSRRKLDNDYPGTLAMDGNIQAAAPALVPNRHVTQCTTLSFSTMYTPVAAPYLPYQPPMATLPAEIITNEDEGLAAYKMRAESVPPPYGH